MRPSALLVLVLAAPAGAAVSDLRLTAGYWPSPDETVSYHSTDTSPDQGSYDFDWHPARHVGLAYVAGLAPIGPVDLRMGFELSYTHSDGDGEDARLYITQRTWGANVLTGIGYEVGRGLGFEFGPTFGLNHTYLRWSNQQGGTHFVGSGDGDALAYGLRLAALQTFANGFQFGVDLRALASDDDVDIDYGPGHGTAQTYHHTSQTRGFAAMASLGYRF